MVFLPITRHEVGFYSIFTRNLTDKTMSRYFLVNHPMSAGNDSGPIIYAIDQARLLSFYSCVKMAEG